MIAEEQDRTVSRLRQELGTVDVRSRSDHLDRVLRQVHGRRREQRQQRLQMLAAMAVVVLAVAGAFVVMWRTADGPDQVETASVLDWPVRGDRAGDQDLLSRAEAAWRGSARGPGGPVRAVYAGTSPNRAASFLVVALVSPGTAGRDRVAFVTTPVSVTGKPDARRLLVRSVTTVDATQRGIGFLAAHAAGGDEPISGGATIGVAIAAPGAAEIEVRTSLLDDQADTPEIEPGVLWPVFETGVGAWNSGMTVTSGGRPASFRLAAGVDDARTEPVALRTVDSTLRAIGDDVRPGDLIATPEGVLGVVRDATGTVDTRLTAIGQVGLVRLAISTVPGRFVDGPGGTTLFEATGPGEFTSGNRVLLVGRDRPELSFNVARLSRSGGLWQAERVVDPLRTSAVMRIENP
ncbi:hypothetical protein [Actinokineospora sp. NBRC 105648]|uniref:hypothetical protein n=1 Tax=Actinokineospora sp. NBRC 105648 TaxID=3032206 RepID=UPI0024A085AE|nr:hypothetical protein [Actinokineospora sp. NBRC 105648]GLZ40007.1 hypothetical protein Acsp05_36310 [Actinokineospora sp. NBRC 105648]